MIAELVDLQYGKPLRAEDARLAARGVLDDLIEVADGDESGEITLAEAREASWQGARALGQQLFRSVDANGDGRLELAEFQKAVGSTTALAFDAGHINDNGSLTEQRDWPRAGWLEQPDGHPRADPQQLRVHV